MITVNAYRYTNEQREKDRLRSKFECYFAPPLLEKIIKGPSKLQTSDKKTLTVLFSDISGFTSWCTTKSPEEIRHTLNEYFNEMTKIVFNYEGTIDKFMGDGMMVFFGDPIDQPDHALRAVKTAIEMQKKARLLKTRWEVEGGLSLQLRIGINMGEMFVGNMGSESRLEYTVIGSNVNISQRLENLAPIGGILVSEAVYESVKDHVSAKFHGNVQVKGISQSLRVYTISIDRN
jgi:adenylate cyclase